MSGVTLSNITKKYGEVQVIHGIDLEIKDGEFCVFVGPSGCGKSTLLKLLAGFDAVNVNYKASPQAMTDLLGGRLDMVMTSSAASLVALSTTAGTAARCTAPEVKASYASSQREAHRHHLSPG